MGSVYHAIDDGLREFICEQRIYFVASAPLSERGHVNVSPKGLDSLRILGPREVAYLDLTGSGIETVAHVRENGRLTLMFCAFQGRPRIVRLQGQARIVEPGDADWDRLAGNFPNYTSRRSIVLLDVDRIADACGYGVPLYEYAGERTQLVAWAERQGTDGIAAYQAQKNRQSIDGLPGLSQPANPQP
jgi:hypothetical protein